MSTTAINPSDDHATMVMQDMSDSQTMSEAWACDMSYDEYVQFATQYDKRVYSMKAYEALCTALNIQLSEDNAEADYDYPNGLIF